MEEASWKSSAAIAVIVVVAAAAAPAPAGGQRTTSVSMRLDALLTVMEGGKVRGTRKTGHSDQATSV